MSLPNLILGTGLTIGKGITFGTGSGSTPSFTITSGDIITFNTLLYGGYSNWSSAGFDCSGYDQIYNGICYTITQGLHDSIAAILTGAGLNVSDAYAWNVSWTTGGTGLARIGLDANGSNTIAIAPIDPTDTRWQTGNNNSNSLAGTFTFPATFTLYSPYTQLAGATNWC